jgi:Spy/CpxP family protein refolding chaperone
MDIFAQKKLFVRMVLVLCVLNIALMIFFGLKESRPEPPPQSSDFKDVSAILEKELNLSGQQVAQIKQLRSDFFAKEKKLGKIIRDERDSMNVIMFNKNTDGELVKSLARRVAENEYQMELLRFEQAQQLKSICTSAQLEKFEGLVLEIRDYFRPDNQPKRK